MFRKLRVLLAMPVAVFLFAVGWSLIWIDSKKSPNRSVGTNAAAEGNNDELSFELVQESEVSVESAQKR